MKAPLSWIKEYVDINCSAKELEEKLFSCGFEVEETVYLGKNIEKIVSCKIIEIEKHPNADKLSVTKVDAGKFGIKQIITSAKNIFKNAVVPVALDGATLSNGEKIFNGELRGVLSEGMFCSGEELGINDDWYEGASVNGILILDNSFHLGEEVKDLLEINDVIFDINVTANRSDCQSILGIAREVAAVLNKPFRMPDLSYKVNNDVSTKENVNVCVDATDLCQRYISHLVKNIKIDNSPRWLKRRLFLMGIRSINNIVDITNYVLMEIGQPMHAFDLQNIGGESIIVRRADNEEKIITLDEKSFSLNESNLVICDKNKPIALAGVMGGLNSEIKSSTENVLFESATFSRDNIRKTSKMLGQRSDSSARFEKGVDVYSVEIGMKRALNLISSLNCGEIACDEYDVCSVSLENKVISTTVKRVNDVLGINISDNTIEDILNRLGFKVSIDNGNLSVVVPLYRDDMESYQDIAEEIIREYGYSHIDSTLLKTSSITNGGLNENQKFEAEVKNLLVGFGFNEIITYSFVPEKDLDSFGFDKSKIENNVIKLLNPLSEDVSVMRTSLIPSILRSVLYNLNRQNKSGRMFELAKVYYRTSNQNEIIPVEKLKLSFAVFGNEEDFFSLKGCVEGLLQAFCNGKKVNYKKSEEKYLHPTRSADIIMDNLKIGSFGQVHPLIAEKIGLDKSVYCGEIDYESLFELYNEKIMCVPISKFPSVERDLALIVDKNVTCQEVQDTIISASGEFLIKVSLFDVYQGNQVEKDKKSMAFNLVFSSCEKTLTVEEIDDIIKNILKALKEKIGAVLR